MHSTTAFEQLMKIFKICNHWTSKELPCSMKILWEFYFADWRFFVVCGNKFLRFEMGSFENEALENEDRNTKHPNRENEVPKSRNHCTLKDNNFKSCMMQAKAGGGNEASAPSKVHQSIPRSIWFLACTGRAVLIVIGWAHLSCHPFFYISLC